MFSISCFTRAIRLFSSFLFGSTGEIVTEKSGHLNLGTPGIMAIGGVGGCLGVSLAMKQNMPGVLVVILALLFSMIFSAVCGLIYSFLTVSLRANQNICGLTLTTFGVGFANFLSVKFSKSKMPSASNYFNNLFHIKEDASPILLMFFSYGIMVILAIVLAISTTLVLRYTRIGLNLRATGESPACADAQGISVSKYRYLATIVGAMITGFGGLSFVMDFSCGVFDQASSIESLGWLAVALVIFSMWKPSISIVGSLIFAYLYVMPIYIAAQNNTKELISMVPYIFTIVVLVLTSILGGRRVQPPSSLGQNYFREDR